MDQFTNEMAEPTPEQQQTNNLESKCLHQESNNLEVKPPCEVCDSESIGLFNLFGQQLRNDLPFSEMFPTDRFLCKECFCEKCGEKHSADFNANKFDEAIYNNNSY